LLCHRILFEHNASQRSLGVLHVVVILQVTLESTSDNDRVYDPITNTHPKAKRSKNPRRRPRKIDPTCHPLGPDVFQVLSQWFQPALVCVVYILLQYPMNFEHSIQTDSNHGLSTSRMILVQGPHGIHAMQLHPSLLFLRCDDFGVLCDEFDSFPICMSVMEFDCA
jgi:hypothetical protein